MPGKIPQSFIDDLLSRTDIVDVIAKHVPLKKAGREYKACCPFHEEKSPSFSVSQVKQFYYCFGCNAQGNAIGFLMEQQGMHFVDAVEMLASDAGMEVPKSNTADRSMTTPVYETVSKAANHYHASLVSSPQIVTHLKSLGVDNDTIEKYQIGYAMSDTAGLSKVMSCHPGELASAGLVNNNEGRFRDRLMLPVKDRRGRPVAFIGASLSKTEPRYLTTLPTAIYSNSANEIFGLYDAKKASKANQQVVALLDVVGVLSLSAKGINNAVSIYGTAIDQALCETLYQVASTVVYVFPDTRAGHVSASRSIKATLPCLTDGRDAKYAYVAQERISDSDALFEAICCAEPIVDRLHHYLSKASDKEAIVDKASTYIATMPEGVYRTLATQRVQELTTQRPTSSPISQGESPKPMTLMQQAILLILQIPACVTDSNIRQADLDQTIPGASILSKLIGFCQESGAGTTTQELLDHCKELPEYGFLEKLAARTYSPPGHPMNNAGAAAYLAQIIPQLSRTP